MILLWMETYKIVISIDFQIRKELLPAGTKRALFPE